MDRITFLKRTGLGIGLAFIPSLLNGKNEIKTISSDNGLKPKIIQQSEGEVINVIGDIQIHKINGKDTNNQIVEWVNEVDPGVGIPPHIHTKEDEIFRVLKGQVELMVGDKTTILNEGDVAYAPKNIVHSWKIIGTEKASMCTSAFPAGIEVMFEELGKLPPGPPDFAKVSEICGRFGIKFV